MSIEGLTLELGRRDGIVIRGGEHCLVAGCTLRRLGEDGVVIQGGSDHGVFGCDLYCLGRGGTRVEGGDRKTLTPGRHFVENCHIYDFSRVHRSYAPAVHLEGCGNRIAHNLFHDSPHQAMRIEGNDHLVEFNEVSNVVYESDDQGGVDMFYDPGYRGNVFRYNFWHHIGSGLACGQAGIRLDDIICGVLIYGNVFYRCSHGGFGGVQMHGGKRQHRRQQPLRRLQIRGEFFALAARALAKGLGKPGANAAVAPGGGHRAPPTAPATRSWPGSTRI